MINEISILDYIKEDSSFVSLPFYFNGEPIESAKWGMTLLNANSMRFRWNEENPNRKKIAKYIEEISPHICSGSCVGEKKECDCKKIITPVELIHSKIVVESKIEGDTKNLQADGILTKNKRIVPTVTVADCVPLFLYDTKSGAFGSFHSGWKGTGIIGEGVKKMCELYGTTPENICAAIGPHIDSCCYFVDEARANYFTENFGKDCVEKVENGKGKNERGKMKMENSSLIYSLSLTNANLFVLKSAGIKEENIVVAKDCTCCTTFKSGKNVFGSFRREAAFLDLPNDEKSRRMTVQAAFCFRK